MEFDARVKEPDKVGWTCKVTMPDGENVELKFRDYANIPGKISMRAGDIDTQMWRAFDWGLIEPKHWPRDNDDASAVNLFSEIPMTVTVKIYRAWQAEAGVTLGESNASETSSESTETS